jgi:hypothetical protein
MASPPGVFYLSLLPKIANKISLETAFSLNADRWLLKANYST